MPSVTYSCVLQVRPSTVMFLARLLLERREAIGTRTGRRALPPWSQAVLVLRWLLDGTRVKQLAADHAIGICTDRLARQGPGVSDCWWSGKHHRHGGNLQILCLPDGFLIWV